MTKTTNMSMNMNRTLLAMILLGVSLSLQAGPFSLPDLPYATKDLEPYIDQLTMEIHHDRHHRAYVNNLNDQVENYPELADLSLEEMMGRISSFNQAVRDNGGGHYNHDLFWKIMAEPGTGGEASAALRSAIDRDLGGMDSMKEAFAAAASTRFGSGWAWLIVDEEGHLAISSTANQDNPLMDVVEQRGTPILALDVWEHAYYLQYQNRRGDYLNFWWNVVNWDEVSKRFEQATDEG